MECGVASAANRRYKRRKYNTHRKVAQAMCWHKHSRYTMHSGVKACERERERKERERRERGERGERESARARELYLTTADDVSTSAWHANTSLPTLCMPTDSKGLVMNIHESWRCSSRKRTLSVRGCKPGSALRSVVNRYCISSELARGELRKSVRGEL